MSTVYEIVTDRIIQKITESNRLPWSKPWRDVPEGGALSFSTKKAYRGMNRILLDGGDSPWWITPNQVKKNGGTIRKGSKTQIATLWQFNKLKNKDTGKETTVPMVRYYRVLNLSDVEGIEAPKIKKLANHDPIETAEEIVNQYPDAPEINRERSNRAFYRPSTDSITVPLLGQFKTADKYYSTLFHEMGHSTGHTSRLNRDMSGHFGNHAYSKEELIAEFTACFLCERAGINTTTDNSAAYLQGWVSKLREEPKWLLWAAGRAQRAADHILNETVNYDAETTAEAVTA